MSIINYILRMNIPPPKGLKGRFLVDGELILIDDLIHYGDYAKSVNPWRKSLAAGIRFHKTSMCHFFRPDEEYVVNKEREYIGPLRNTKPRSPLFLKILKDDYRNFK